MQIQGFKVVWSRAITISEEEDILSLPGEFASLDQESYLSHFTFISTSLAWRMETATYAEEFISIPVRKIASYFHFVFCCYLH